jgi:hypothetical protein
VDVLVIGLTWQELHTLRRARGGLPYR